MLSLFKRKSKVEKLQLRYQRLLKESKLLSHKDRQAGEQKYMEAQIVMDEIVSHYPLK